MDVLRRRCAHDARILVIVLAGFGLGGCAMEPFGLPGGTLQGARQACNQQYPRRVGNYLPHAHCVNAAIERFAVPIARHPDLIRLQERVRTHLSAQIDRRRLSPHFGEDKMAQADRLIAAAEQRRDASDREGARRRTAAVEAMLQ
jgi:hypothetical protein